MHTLRCVYTYAKKHKKALINSLLFFLSFFLIRLHSTPAELTSCGASLNMNL